MLAAQKGNSQALAKVLDLVEWNPWRELGGDLDLQNNHGDTALMLAAAYNRPECVELLVKAGADMTLRRKKPKFRVRLTIGGRDLLVSIFDAVVQLPTFSSFSWIECPISSYHRPQSTPRRRRSASIWWQNPRLPRKNAAG